MRAKITEISISDGIISAKFLTKLGAKFQMVGLLGNENLKVGDFVELDFKSSNVIISKDKLESCSLTNEIFCEIINVNIGKILSVLELENSEFKFESIITSNSAKRLNLKLNDKVYAYIKATSLYIKEKI